MKITLKKHFAESFAAAQKASHPGLSRWITGKLGRYGEESVTLDTAAFGDEEAETGLAPAALEDLLYEHAKATKNQSVMMFISSIRLALKDVMSGTRYAQFKGF